MSFMTDESMRLGNRIAYARKELFLTQAQLAEKLNISKGQLYKFEKGQNRIPAVSLFKIAAICNQDMEWFFADNTNESEDFMPDNKNKILQLLRPAMF